MLGFRIPDADQAMLISGKKSGDDAPFQVVLGHRKFAPLFLYKVVFLTLEQQQSQIREDCFTKEKIPVRIVATIAFKVPANTRDVINAGQRFLRDQAKMPLAVGQITAGAVRGIVGEMKLEEIISERTTLQQKVLEHAKDELSPQGLQVDTLNISDIQDLSDGASAIAALSAPHLAAIRMAATVAQANADQQAAQAQQTAAQQTADYDRQTQVIKAGYAAEVAKATADSQADSQVAQAEADQRTRLAQAKAEAEVGEATAERDRRQRVAQAKADAETGKAAAAAAQAGPLAQATAQHEVAVAQTTLAQQQADQRKEEQRRDVVVPAQAQAEARVAQAQADAQATELAAAAAASSDRVSLDKQIIEQLPQVAAAIAEGLKGSQLSILNGSDGLTQMATGVLSQAMSILDTARGMRTADGNGNGRHAAPVSLGVGATEGAEGGS